MKEKRGGGAYLQQYWQHSGAEPITPTCSHLKREVVTDKENGVCILCKGEIKGEYDGCVAQIVTHLLCSWMNLGRAPTTQG